MSTLILLFPLVVVAIFWGEAFVKMARDCGEDYKQHKEELLNDTLTPPSQEEEGADTTHLKESDQNVRVETEIYSVFKSCVSYEDKIVNVTYESNALINNAYELYQISHEASRVSDLKEILEQLVDIEWLLCNLYHEEKGISRKLEVNKRYLSNFKSEGNSRGDIEI